MWCKGWLWRPSNLVRWVDGKTGNETNWIVTTYQVSVSDEKMLKLWHKIFSISDFLVSRADSQNIGQIITKLLGSVWGRETDLHTRFQSNRTQIFHVSSFGRPSAGKLVESDWMAQFWKVSRCKAYNQNKLPIYHAKKKQGDSDRDRHSDSVQVIHFPIRSYSVANKNLESPLRNDATKNDNWVAKAH